MLGIRQIYRGKPINKMKKEISSSESKDILKKKNSLLITSAAALVALVAVTGLAMSTYASETDTDTTNTDDTQDVRGSFGRGAFGQNLTDEEREELEADREARRAERDAEMQSVRDAIEANDYSAWKSAISAIDEDASILEKINESNFSRLVEMHNLRDQADDIQEELGIERGDMHGGCLGEGRGMGSRGHRGM